MWTSADLKEKAKIALTGTYWKAFAITLVFGALSGGASYSSGFSNIGNYGGDMSESFDITVFLVIIGIAIFTASLSIVFNAFVTSPIEVGVRKYFITSAEIVDTGGLAEFNLIGHGFKGGTYMEVVKTMFIKNVYVFLWSLLLIIPGIIKGYSYAMVPYILADNPKIGVSRAIELSSEMTQNEKMDMFILDLSFFGWWILGFLACCIGVIFVNPYYYATHAELYRTLREKALDEDMCTYEELGFLESEDETTEDEELEDETSTEDEE